MKIKQRGALVLFICVPALNIDKSVFQPRMETVIGIVEKNLSKYGVTISHPNGGYFLWLKMPPEIDSERVAEIAKVSEKVTFVKGYL